MKKLLYSFIIIVFLFTIFLSSRSAQADMAPPGKPPGANLRPGDEITQVRMVAETVLIDILSQSGVNSLGQAKVTAKFTMRNLGSETEFMAARFPVSVINGYGSIPEITDFKVSVNGKNTSTRRISGGEDSYISPYWEEFDITFPSDEDVEVIITYTLEAAGFYPLARFEYILSTGAGWKDTIGSADIIVRFPYEVSLQNFVINPADIVSLEAVLAGKEARWHYEELEPTLEDNITIVIVSPEAWKKVLIERDNVNQNPNDGEAWGRLGMSYKEIIHMPKSLRMDEGGLQLYALSVQAYENCLELLPDDALWHAGFAELLWLHYIDFWGDKDTDELLRTAEEINRALELAPQNEKIIEIANEMTWDSNFAVKNSDGSYSWFWLTATPAPTAEMVETEANPTFTPAPSIKKPLVQTDNVSEQTPVPKPSSPICVSAALPLALVAFIFARRKQF